MSNPAERRLEAAELYEEALARREQGNPSGAFARYRRVLEIARELGDVRWQAQLAAELGEMYHAGCDLIDARRWYEEALELFRQLGDGAREGETLLHLAEVEQLAGETSRAEALFRECLERQVAAGDRQREGLVRSRLGRLLWGMKQEQAGMTELIRGWELLAECSPAEAEAVLRRIRELREQVGRVRFRRIVEAATDNPEHRKLITGT
jgi:tetratricopeptide (TPR) repeat protein